MYKCLFNDENVTNDDHFVALVYDFIFVAFVVVKLVDLCINCSFF